MEGFEWAQNSLDAATPHELQERGVNVYFAPNIPVGVSVVDLGTGMVRRFPDDNVRPQGGYYADYDSLERYCRETGLPLTETNGQVSVQPVGTEEAGDPLRHEGH